MGTALYDLERHGLIMHAGRAWKLTPHGDDRWRDVLAAAGRATAS